MQRIGKWFFGVGLFIALSGILAVVVRPQTVPVNTKRIDLLENSQAKQDDKLDAVISAHGTLSAQIAGIAGKLETDEKVALCFFAAILTMLTGAFLQARSTHKMVNGQREVLVGDLNTALNHASSLREKLTECMGREACPLLGHKEVIERLAVPPEKKT